VRRFRRLHPGHESREAAAQVAAWKYPRAIRDDEKIWGCWYRYGPDCITWLIYTTEDLTHASVHVAVPEEAKGYWFSRRWAIGVEVLAESLGVEVLEASDCDDCHIVARYMPRLGWTLGGDDTWLKVLD